MLGGSGEDDGVSGKNFPCGKIKPCWIIQNRHFSLLKVSASREHLSDPLAWISNILTPPS